MKLKIKTTSLNQAVWRAEKKKKLGIESKRIQLETQEIEEIRKLRFNGYTLSDIADRYDRCIRTIEKHCKDIDPYFVSTDGYKVSNSKNGSHNNRTTKGHPWRKGFLYCNS